eukprot:TRINITY_DN7116_c0_g1_i2.p1 TRINITY_DN7116_c0_g1~~TRINITY_DN7116_c0_g1_i2.p1  ORF type:complete len:127 (+),score=22.04 TRINITY_DN7116_c0_g1_i2:82-462(+)
MQEKPRQTALLGTLDLPDEQVSRGDDLLARALLPNGQDSIVDFNAICFSQYRGEELAYETKEDVGDRANLTITMPAFTRRTQPNIPTERDRISPSDRETTRREITRMINFNASRGADEQFINFPGM